MRSLGIHFMAGALAALSASSIAEAKVFKLVATDVMIEQPAPLFGSDRITGLLVLDDAIAPGQSFGSASILDLILSFRGITGTLADIQADIAPGDVQGFGTRSIDGLGFSVFDLRFGFRNGDPACSFFCVGQIVINSPIGPNDPSNFFAFDAFDDTSLSVISSYTASFQAVPEPASWALLIVGFGVVGATLRHSRKQFARQEFVDNR
jgi:hypothetical protein